MDTNLSSSHPAAALLYGVLGAASCNLATRLKSLGYDDSLDVCL